MNIASAGVLCFLSFYLYYISSKRVDIAGSELRKLALRSPAITRCLAAFLLIIAGAVFFNYYGVGAGFFIVLVLLMNVASMAVLFLPLVRHPEKKKNNARKS